MVNVEFSNRRIDQLNILPYFIFLPLVIAAAFSIFSLVLLIHSIGDFGVMFISIFILCMTQWLFWRCILFISGFKKEARKLVIERGALKIYRPYGNPVDVVLNEKSQFELALKYALIDKSKLNRSNYDYNIELSVGNGKIFNMTLSVKDFESFRGILKGYGVSADEVDATLIKMFV